MTLRDLYPDLTVYNVLALININKFVLKVECRHTYVRESKISLSNTAELIICRFRWSMTWYDLVTRWPGHAAPSPRPGSLDIFRNTAWQGGWCDPPGVPKPSVVVILNKDQAIALNEYDYREYTRDWWYIVWPLANIQPSYGRSKVKFRENRRFSTLQDKVTQLWQISPWAHKSSTSTIVVAGQLAAFRFRVDCFCTVPVAA